MSDQGLFLIPWTGRAFTPLVPSSAPPLKKKNWPIAPKPGHWHLYGVNEFNIEKKFKKHNLLACILKLISCVFMFRVQFITNFTIKALC